MFVICIDKLALKIKEKNEMTLLPTQYFEIPALFVQIFRYHIHIV